MQDFINVACREVLQTKCLNWDPLGWQAGGEVGLKVEKLIHNLLKYEVDMEETALKKAVNAAYNLQNVVYSMDDCDRNSLDSIRLLIRRYQPSNTPNASTSQVLGCFHIKRFLVRDC